MTTTDIDAGLRYGRYAAASHASHLGQMKVQAEKLRAAHQFEYEIIRPEASREFFDSPAMRHGGLYFPDAPYMNPVRLAHGNYLGAVRKGARVIGNTRVLNIERQKDKRYRISTTRGKIRARGVLLAVGGYGVRNFRTHRDVLPIQSWLIATEPLSAEQLSSVWRHPMSMKNTKHNFDVIIPSADAKRLIISARIGVGFASPEAAAIALTKYARKLFPQLGEVRTSHVWQGVFCLTKNRRKCLFQDEEGVFTLTADNGGGVGLMHWLGHKAALQMLGYPEGKTVLASNTPPPSWLLVDNRSDWFMPAAVALYDLRDKFNF